MRGFMQYLSESEKKYGFRVKIAHELDKAMVQKIHDSLTKFGISDISSVKHMPVGSDQPEFSHLGINDVYALDIVCDYPTTPHEIMAAIHAGTSIPLSLVHVRTPGQEVIAAPIAPAHEAQLDQPLPKNNSPQLLADLQAALSKRSEFKYDSAGNDTNADKVFISKKGTTTNTIPQHNTSVVGTHKTRLPNPKK